VAMYLQERQIPIWAFSPKFSTGGNVVVALTKMANFRQAKVDETTLESYRLALEGLDLRAFQVACAVIAEARPREGETLFPSLGYILDVMEEARERFPKSGQKELNTSPAVTGQKALPK